MKTMFPVLGSGGFEETQTPICFDEDKFVQDLLLDSPASLENSHNIVKKRPRKLIEKNEGASTSGVAAKKKTGNRLLEKQRRQEMAALHVSLRNLLPLEYVKGKRAISDHMQQAVNYINDMKKNIEEMKKKRDMLKKKKKKKKKKKDMCVDAGKQSSNSPVNIKLFKDGLMEITISSSLPLSKVLKDLLSRQLDVIDCVSTRDTPCFVHKIQIKLNDCTSIELSELQEGLVNLVRLP